MDQFVQTLITAATNAITTLIGTILSAIAGLISAIVLGFIAVISATLTNVFSLDMNKFYSLFPVAKNIEAWVKALALAFVLALFVYALFRNVFSGLGFTAEDPFKLIFRFILANAAVVLIYPFLVNGMLVCFSKPYVDLSKVATKKLDWSRLGSNLAGSWDFNKVVPGANFVTDQLGKIVVPCIMVIITLCIGINYFKVVLEVVERYLAMCLTVFFSPMAASSLVLESTADIFKRFVRMFIGQMLLLYANSFSIILANDALMTYISDFLPNTEPTKLLSDGLLLLAFLKVAQHFDNYLRDLGVNAGITGGSMVEEIVAVSQTLKGVGKQLNSAGLNPTSMSAGAKAFHNAKGAILGGTTAGVHPFNVAAAANVGTNAAKAAATAAGIKPNPFINFASKMGVHSGLGDISKATGFSGHSSGNPYGRYYSSQGAFTPHDQFATGDAAKAYAAASVGNDAMRDFHMNPSTVKANSGCVMGYDSKGNLQGMFKENPAMSDAAAKNVTPFTGADGQQYFQAGINNLDTPMKDALTGYYNQGSGTMDVGAIKDGLNNPVGAADSAGAGFNNPVDAGFNNSVDTADSAGAGEPITPPAPVDGSSNIPNPVVTSDNGNFGVADVPSPGTENVGTPGGIGGTNISSAVGPNSSSDGSTPIPGVSGTNVNTGSGSSLSSTPNVRVSGGGSSLSSTPNVRVSGGGITPQSILYGHSTPSHPNYSTTNYNGYSSKNAPKTTTRKPFGNHGLNLPGKKGKK